MLHVRRDVWLEGILLGRGRPLTVPLSSGSGLSTSKQTSKETSKQTNQPNQSSNRERKKHQNKTTNKPNKQKTNQTHKQTNKQTNKQGDQKAKQANKRASKQTRIKGAHSRANALGIGRSHLRNMRTCPSSACLVQANMMAVSGAVQRNWAGNTLEAWTSLHLVSL